MKSSGKYRSNKPTGEAMSARVNTMSKPGGPLSYATRGQMTVREQMHGGKSGIKLGTGYYPSPAVGPGKHGRKSSG